MSKWSSAFRDSRWQKLRLEIMDRDGWECVGCGKKDGVTLNVHHAYYESGKAPWEYPSETLTTFCEDCHKEFHIRQKHLLLKIINSSINNGGIKSVFAKINGYFDASFIGPAFSVSDDYCSGYAAGKKTISDVDALSVTRENYIELEAMG